jgi:hypothetical protein
MKRRLALVLLALLIAGSVSLAVAQVRVVCTFCNLSDWTTACYQCPRPECGQWTVIDAYSWDGSTPPFPIYGCQYCGYEGWISAQYCLCYSEICKGGIFWP